MGLNESSEQRRVRLPVPEAKRKSFFCFLFFVSFLSVFPQSRGIRLRD